VAFSERKVEIIQNSTNYG